MKLANLKTIALLVAIGSTTLVSTGCSTNPFTTGSDFEVIQTSGDKPNWSMKTIYEEGSDVYFVGISNHLVTERNSRESAHTSALAQAAKYYQTKATQDNKERANYNGTSSETIDGISNSGYQESAVYASYDLPRMGVEDTYFEIWQTENDRIFYKTYMLIKGPVSK